MSNRGWMVVAGAAFLALPMVASAQLTANVSVTTNYKFRGQDQKSSSAQWVKPALQGGVDYAFGDSGFYVGNWNSTVDWLDNNKLEMDFYGGYKFKAADVDWDVGLLTYVYPGNTLGNTTELYGSGTLGPVTVKYSHTVSKDYFGWAGSKYDSTYKGRNTGYLNVAFAQEVAPKTTLKLSVGYTRFSSDIKDLGVPNYLDYSVGGAYDLGDGFSLGAAWVGANKTGAFGFVNKGRAIVSLTKAF
ncbi:TorF family putative porin [Comamonas sp. BIGb0152]|uniref:TorF family putative porin n=1 Tax=Comamonas sp. BIGb0152 TaxID=2940601 RepID=UPI0021680829|nr:TorF family putative porin [Comamonas sp. BIGb0152]